MVNNNSYLPGGWVLLLDLENCIKKPITPKDELQDAIENLAQDIALIKPDPIDWVWWCVIF